MVVILPYCIKAKRCEHNALGYWSVLALCLTKVRSSRARCPATALIVEEFIAALNNNAANNLFINTFTWFGVAVTNKILG